MTDEEAIIEYRGRPVQTTCKNCGDVVLWRISRNGKWVLCDLDTEGSKIFNRDVHSCHWDSCQPVPNKKKVEEPDVPF